MSLKRKPELVAAGARYLVVGFGDPVPTIGGKRLAEVTSASEVENVLRRERLDARHIRPSFGRLGARYRVFRYPGDTPQIRAVTTAEQEGEAPQTKSWIAFQVMDDDDPPQPVKNTRVNVKDSKGVTHRAHTDSNGYVRIDGLEAGSCDVTFPDHDDSNAEEAEASTGSLLLRLPINPSDQAARDDKFTLRALNSNAEIVKTVRDDCAPNNDTLDLLFDDLDPTDFYTLEVDPGEEGEPYILRDPKGRPLEHVSLSALKALSGG